jgi:hypothetical protein
MVLSRMDTAAVLGKVLSVSSVVVLSFWSIHTRLADVDVVADMSEVVSHLQALIVVSREGQQIWYMSHCSLCTASRNSAC